MARLLARLRQQIADLPAGKVGILKLVDAGDESIGVKRQRLLEAAWADYVSFIDDDDAVSPDYCAAVLGVIDGPDPPDVVGFRLRMFEDRRLVAYAVHSYDAGRIAQPVPKGCKRYDRQPNHLNPVWRELAIRCGGFKPEGADEDRNHGEDGRYAVRLSRLNPRPRERFIDAVMYDYLFLPHDRRGRESTNEKRTAARKR